MRTHQRPSLNQRESCASGTVDAFRFRSSKFMKNAQIKVTQGDATLYSQTIRNVIVNEMMSFSAAWIHEVDPSAGSVKLELV